MAEKMADKGHRVLMQLLSAFSYNECIPYNNGHTNWATFVRKHLYENGF